MSPTDLAALCAEHLEQEEKLLAAVVPKVRALKEAFLRRQPDGIEQNLERQQEFLTAVSRIKVGRERLRMELAQHLRQRPIQTTITQAVETLPEPSRAALRASAARIRALAGELVTTIHWLAVHSRVHLDAYQRLLRDITGTRAASGRYGAAGKPEAAEYRPLFEIHG